MSGFEVLFRDYASGEDSSICWEKGCPIVVAAVQVSKHVATSREYLQVRFRNITDKKVLELHWTVVASYRDGSCQSTDASVSDAEIAAGGIFAPSPVLLDGAHVQSVSITVAEVVFEDGVWRTSSETCSYPKASLLGLSQEEREMRKYLLNRARGDSGAKGATWTCVCGTLNQGSESCRACGNSSPLESYPADGCVQDGGDYWICACGAPNVGRETCWSCLSDKALLMATESSASIRKMATEQQAAERIGKRRKKARLIVVFIVLAMVLALEGFLSLHVTEGASPDNSSAERSEMSVEGSWVIVIEAENAEDALPTTSSLDTWFENVNPGSTLLMSLYKNGKVMVCGMVDGAVSHYEGTWQIDQESSYGEEGKVIAFSGMLDKVATNVPMGESTYDFDEENNESMIFSGLIQSDYYGCFIEYAFEGTDVYFGGIPFGSIVEDRSYEYVVPESQMKDGSCLKELVAAQNERSQIASTQKSIGDDDSSETASTLSQHDATAKARTPHYSVDLEQLAVDHPEFRDLNFRYNDVFNGGDIDSVGGSGYDFAAYHEGEEDGMCVFMVNCYSGNLRPDGVRFAASPVGEMETDMGVLSVYVEAPYGYPETGESASEQEAQRLAESIVPYVTLGSLGEPSASNGVKQDYVLPESDSRAYSRSELDGLSDWELYLARNEIFARHGRMFNNEDLQAYFASCSWYNGTREPSEFDEWFVPNEYEKANAALIMEMEQDANSPYLN